MSENLLGAEMLRVLATRLREARETCGWTQQQLADRSGVQRTTIVAIEQGEHDFRPEELIELASALGRGVSELVQRSALYDEPFSARREALAIEAWRRGEISEGQLAHLLRTDRVGAREKVWQMELPDK